MYRVVIADAESLSRVGIRCSVPWDELSMQVVGEAQDGAEALKKVCELGAHILIMEMKLPKMDGLQLMRELRTQQIPVKIVVISSCDAYPYVHEAMKLGAYDYLLKSTATDSDLRQVLTALRQQIIYTEDSDQTDTIAIQVENAKYFRRLLLELSEQKTAEKLYTLFPTEQYTLCCFLPIRKQSTEADALFQLVLQVNRDFAPVASFQYSDFQTFSVILHTQDKTWIDGYVEAVVSAADARLEITCCACISRPESTYENFLPLYRELLTYCEGWFYMKESKVVWYDSFQPLLVEEAEPTFIEQSFDHMKEAISFHNLDLLEHLTSLVFDYLHQHPIVLPKIIKNDFINIVNACANMLRRMHFTPSEMNLLFSYTDITEQGDIYELEAWINVFLQKYRQLIRKHYGKTACNEAVSRSLRFIDEHFQDPITLTQIASNVNLSVNYFSALFKRTMEIGVIEYLNRHRIEQAKILLSTQGDLRVAEVAYRVGFDNISYFSKTFKQRVGRTPGAYKKMQNHKIMIESDNKLQKNMVDFEMSKIIG